MELVSSARKARHGGGEAAIATCERKCQSQSISGIRICRDQGPEQTVPHSGCGCTGAFSHLFREDRQFHASWIQDPPPHDVVLGIVFSGIPARRLRDISHLQRWWSDEKDNPVSKIPSLPTDGCTFVLVPGSRRSRLRAGASALGPCGIFEDLMRLALAGV